MVKNVVKRFCQYISIVKKHPKKGLSTYLDISILGSSTCPTTHKGAAL
jgi:hypothetical protein